MAQRIRSAVIPAAGRGTRLLPASKAVPKEMFPVVDRPVIQYVIEEGIESGISDFVIVSNRDKQSIERHFKPERTDHEYGDQGEQDGMSVETICASAELSWVYQNEPLGLGHAVLLAEESVQEEAFAVMLPDDIMCGPIPVMAQLFQVYRRFPGAVIAAKEVPWESVSDFGLFDVEPVKGSDGGRLYRVRSVVEKPPRDKAPSNLAVMGRYLLPSSVFECLRTAAPGALGEIQLTDGIQGLIEQDTPVYAYVFDGDRFEVGDPLGFLTANIEIALRSRKLGGYLQKFLTSRLPRK